MCNSVAAQLVGHETTRFLSLTLQEFSEESPRRTPVPTGLDEKVNQVTVLVHGAPQILALIFDRDEDFVQKPRISESTLTSLQPRTLPATRSPSTRQPTPEARPSSGRRRRQPSCPDATRGRALAMDDQKDQQDWAPSMEEGGRLSSTGPRRERVLPVQVDSRRSTSKSDSRSASCRIGACVQRAQSNDRAWSTRVVRDRSVTNLRVGALGASFDLRNNAAARWDVARLLSVSSVIHDRPSTPRSSFGQYGIAEPTENGFAASVSVPPNGR